MLSFVVIEPADFALGELVHSLRKGLTLAHMERIVDLGSTLDEIVVKTRFSSEDGDRKEATLQSELLLSGSCFPQSERTMWYV